MSATVVRARNIGWRQHWQLGGNLTTLATWGEGIVAAATLAKEYHYIGGGSIGNIGGGMQTFTDQRRPTPTPSHPRGRGALDGSSQAQTMALRLSLKPSPTIHQL